MPSNDCLPHLKASHSVHGVAHPKPDSLLYFLMIRACAGTALHSGYLAKPERALDLSTEMRSDAKCEPIVGAYNAIILGCARSKDFETEAFRLVKKCLTPTGMYLTTRL